MFSVISVYIYMKGGVAKRPISENMEQSKMDIINSKKSFIVIARFIRELTTIIRCGKNVLFEIFT